MIEDMQLEYLESFSTSSEMWNKPKNVYQRKGHFNYF